MFFYLTFFQFIFLHDSSPNHIVGRDVVKQHRHANDHGVTKSYHPTLTDIAVLFCHDQWHGQNNHFVWLGARLTMDECFMHLGA